MAGPAKITRVVLKNFKSIAACDVTLGPLTILVGPNGAGKSNFIDAMRFCRDALRTPLDQVFAQRSTNLTSLRHRSPKNPDSMGMRVDFTLGSGRVGSYAFELGPQSPRGFEVRGEACYVRGGECQEDAARFVIQGGKLTSTAIAGTLPNPMMSRLFLVNASGLPEFQGVYDLLAGMEFYTPDPEIMRADLDSSGSSEVLGEDGLNTASVLERLSLTQRSTTDRINQYLRAIVPGLERVETQPFKEYKLLNFYQTVVNSQAPYGFLASSMSDGTLRALAVLVALFQGAGTVSGIPLIGIEEPEAGLHPAATAVLLDAMREASAQVQIVATTHSSDLLDNSGIPTDAIRAVQWKDGETRITRTDSASRSALHERLYTAGELLRMGQLGPDDTERMDEEVQLFR